MKKPGSRIVTGLVTLAVGLGVLVGTTGPATAAAGCETSFDSYTRVQKGSTGDKAQAVECLLATAGFTTTQDGAFSGDDAKALAALQTSHRMKADGRTNAATWAALVSQGTRPALAEGDEGPDVQRLRLTLRALGNDAMTSSSTYDAATVAAVQGLQGKLKTSRTGKVSSSFWKVLQNGGRKLPVVTAPGGATSGGTKGEKALAYAKKQLGEKYKYGAAGPNRWDCSGLTMKAWGSAGKKLPHSAKGQYKKGKKVKKSDLRKGDLVFFYSGPSHVGIYAGGGKVIHSPKPGSKVSYIKIKYMPYKGARRPG